MSFYNRTLKHALGFPANSIKMGDEPVVPFLGDEAIPCIKSIKRILAHLGRSSTIDLPQVVVVGSQGSGKSSVLEAILGGHDFLPKGPHICTRRPLVLQLVQIEDSQQEYAEFLHIPGRKFYDFNEIRTEIQAETDREAGRNKGVSYKEIQLKFFSPNVVDITLVDLPGITKDHRCRRMIMSYIKNPNCLILAVTPAGADITKSDAIQIAVKADPDRNRTIGVVTKSDIVYRGTDASRIYTPGKEISLGIGYVCVVNRSQEDIMLNRTINDALAAEKEFFRGFLNSDKIAGRCGVPQLVKILNSTLGHHINNTVLPGLKSGARAASGSLAKKLATCGKTGH